MGHPPVERCTVPFQNCYFKGEFYQIWNRGSKTGTVFQVFHICFFYHQIWYSVPVFHFTHMFLLLYSFSMYGGKDRFRVYCRDARGRFALSSHRSTGLRKTCEFMSGIGGASGGDSSPYGPGSTETFGTVDSSGGDVDPECVSQLFPSAVRGGSTGGTVANPIAANRSRSVSPGGTTVLHNSAGVAATTTAAELSTTRTRTAQILSSGIRKVIVTLVGTICTVIAAGGAYVVSKTVREASGSPVMVQNHTGWSCLKLFIVMFVN